MRFSTFARGGVHPSDKKELSKGSAIKRIDMPARLVVAMSQHLGAPAVLLKQKGDRVEKGERIGKASGFVSADVHSPVSGTVSDVIKTTLATGVVCDAAVIIPDDKQPLLYENRADSGAYTKEDLLGIIKDSGIVGQGGAAFPTHVKLAVPEGKRVEFLVINGVECEPYLTADYRLMVERTDEVLDGALICSRILDPEKIIIGIEANKPDAVEMFNTRISQRKLPVEVVTLKMKYPQGDEKQLLKAVINREIPSGKLPLDVGAVVMNMGTVWSVFRAVAYGMPLIERVVTVSGECIKEPSNFLVPIGTCVKDILSAAGGYSEEPDKLISGGPMMGFSFYNEDTPITKGTGGITAIKTPESRVRTACLHCGRCVAACPMGLEPTKLYRLITNGRYEEAMKNDLMDCKECGCCAFSCPAHLELVHAFKTGKKLGRKK